MKLSPDQAHALDVIENGPHNCLFLTGKAGTGKSTVLSQVRGRKVFTALTGLAASIINGRTLHSFLSMSPHSKKANYYEVSKRLYKHDYLIIDEISMMNTMLFEEVLNALRFAKFEGKLILVGDFKQLPPVQGDPCYLAPNWNIVHKVELTTNHRQADSGYIDVLNDIREGKVTDRLQAFLRERIVDEPPKDYTAIVPLRKKANKINVQRLSEIEDEPTLFDMKIIEVKQKLFEDEEEYHELVERSSNFVSELVVKEGARVMILVNHPEGQYVNGSTGTLYRFTSEMMAIKLDDGYSVDIPRVDMDFCNGAGKVMFVYNQFPVMLAWATTIHKSQGQSIGKLYVDVKGHFEEGMTYVALSRGKDPNTLRVNDVL